MKVSNSWDKVNYTKVNHSKVIFTNNLFKQILLALVYNKMSNSIQFNS